ncbi:hypothetical protein BGZ93_002128 [Podila epicladia]|nr:hypothetical protein BGZ92_000365 [Podila epicladia]KAG0082936.1 hypothetical protein BGZ93_002128 [Podila epicladia]
MPDGIPGFQHPSAVTNDNLSWLILVNQNMYTHNLITGAIANQVPVPVAIYKHGFIAVINSLSDPSFVPNGYNKSGTQSSLEYSPNNSAKITSITAFAPLAGFRFLPHGLKQLRQRYCCVWRKPLGPARWGSMTDIFLRFNFQDLDLDTDLFLGGPNARDSPSMASAYNGAMMIMLTGPNPTP